ncbi:hypothetical protein [Limnoglobus roseus]|nr:hypothetical protein [Limnoglobus roseus]
MIERGRLPCDRLGPWWRLRPADVEAYAAGDRPGRKAALARAR